MKPDSLYQSELEKNVTESLRMTHDMQITIVAQAKYKLTCLGHPLESLNCMVKVSVSFSNLVISLEEIPLNSSIAETRSNIYNRK